MRYSTLNTLCLGVENSIINRLPPSFKIRWHSDNPLTIFSKFLIPNEIVTTSKVLLESDKFSASSHKSLMLGLILKCSIFCCATFSISSDKSIPTIWEVGIFFAMLMATSPVPVAISTMLVGFLSATSSTKRFLQSLSILNDRM